MTRIDIGQWIKHDPAQRALREAVHTILMAIAKTPTLQAAMIMKGGILLALEYQSTRFTRDIDFSTSAKLAQLDLDRFRADFEAGLVRAVDRLGYGLDCRVQSCKQQPPGNEADFPTIRLTVGYADKSDLRSHRRLLAGNSSQIVQVDYSLNEPEGTPEIVTFDDGDAIRVYSLVDLIAEKLRAILQQEVRRRVRRQDIWDLHFLLIEQGKATEDWRKREILRSLKEKAAARNLPVARDSMRNPEIFRRSQIEYQSLVAEIEGSLPPFEEAYAAVQAYYEGLPWD